MGECDKRGIGGMFETAENSGRGLRYSCAWDSQGGEGGGRIKNGEEVARYAIKIYFRAALVIPPIVPIYGTDPSVWYRWA